MSTEQVKSPEKKAQAFNMATAPAAGTASSKQKLMHKLSKSAGQAKVGIIKSVKNMQNHIERKDSTHSQDNGKGGVQPVVAASEVPTPTTTVTQASPQVKSKAQQHRQRTSMALDDIPVHDKKYHRKKIKSNLRQLGHLRHEVQQNAQNTSQKAPGTALPPKIPLIIRDMTCADGTPLLVPNAREPTHFSNSEFEGHVLPKFKPQPEDPYYKPYFEGKKRNFEIQVQGQFKKSSEGSDLYLGMEIPDPVQFGMVVKALAKLCVTVINRTISGAHYSFGTEQEQPHIAFPAGRALDRIVITAPGDTPPPMGLQMFPETLTKAERCALVHTYVPENTYSFSMHGMYMDFTKWQVCNLPGVRPISLRTFWGDQPLRLIAYKLPKGHTGPHLDSVRQIVFRFELDNIGDKYTKWEEYLHHVERDLEQMADEAETLSVPAADADGNVSNVSNMCLTGDASDRSDLMDISEDNLSRESVDAAPSATPQSKPLFPSEQELKAIAANQPRLTDIWAALYMVGFRSGGGLWFVLNATDADGHTLRCVRSAKSLQVVLMAYAEVVCSGRTVALPRLSAVATPTQHAIQMRELSRSLQSVVRNETDSSLLGPLLRWLIEDYSPTARLMLGRKANFGVVFKPRIDTETVVKEGCVIIANWETRWCECWAVLSSLQLCMYSTSRKKPNWSVHMKNVLCVKPTSGGEADAYHFEVQTLGRVYYFAVATEDERSSWITCIDARMAQFRNESFPFVTDPRDVFVVKSRRWGRERCILNMRNQFISSTLNTHHAMLDTNRHRTHTAESSVNPLQIARDLLTQILEMDSDSPLKALIPFLEATARLKLITLDHLVALTAEERLCFWLNVYHCLLAHALLLVGSPNSTRQIFSFYNDVSYELAGHPFSLGEIEHSILRDPLSNPAKLLQFIIPGHFPRGDERRRAMLTRPEPRINFALNFGAGPTSAVCVYEPETLDQQLDDASRHFLNLTVQVVVEKQRIILPKICEWYPKDFEGDFLRLLVPDQGTTCRSTVVDYIARVVSEPIRSQAEALVRNDKPISFRYQKASWKFWPKLTLADRDAGQ